MSKLGLFICPEVMHFCSYLKNDDMVLIPLGFREIQGYRAPLAPQAPGGLQGLLVSLD